MEVPQDGALLSVGIVTVDTDGNVCSFAPYFDLWKLRLSDVRRSKVHTPQHFCRPIVTYVSMSALLIVCLPLPVPAHCIIPAHECIAHCLPAQCTWRTKVFTAARGDKMLMLPFAKLLLTVHTYCYISLNC